MWQKIVIDGATIIYGSSNEAVIRWINLSISHL
jgi:hypothetical protein